ncbi:MAG: CDGSH iron-sulfur domain-containing protein [Candidatus Riflemargulisbacteria bacterium]
MNNQKIRIIKDGPYIVTGGIPLSEKVIVSKGNVNVFEEGRLFPQQKEYALCRCGNSKNAPYCDGTHQDIEFDGTETASKAKYLNRAELLEGPELDLLDDNRCAYARFCHQKHGNVWQLTERSNNETFKAEAIKAASECPTGRLVAVDKDGKHIEPTHIPSIDIIQDPEENVSSGLFVKGYIPIESSDGETYELQNRVMLCRCGQSKNKPFCNADHVSAEYNDGL